jgi:hypothetical protein
MRDYACECGRSTGYGSMSPAPCRGCSAEPHKLQPTEIETDDGPATLTRCQWCGKTKAEIAAQQLGGRVAESAPNYPTVTIHLVMDEDPTRTACTGTKWEAPRDGEWPTVPREFCVACSQLGKRAQQLQEGDDERVRPVE